MTLRTATAAAVGLILAVGCGADEPAPAPVVSAPPPIRVMTWNLQRGQAVVGPIAVADMAPFAVRIADNRADVVGLQEVTREQVDALTGLLGWGSPHYVETKNPCPTLRPPRPGGCEPFGNAVLSRHPLAEPAQWTLPPAGQEAAVEARVLLRSVVDIGGRRISAYVTHLASNAAETEREAQVEEVLARVEGDRAAAERSPGEPFRPVLLGDLNAGPGSTAVAMVAAGFVDAWAEARGSEPGFTSNPTSTLSRRIDYVLVGRTSGLRPREVSVDPNVLSDHLPVIAELVPV